MELSVLVVPGPASTDMARQAAALLGAPLVALESKVFPDGDSYFRVSDRLDEEDLVIIQSTYPPQDRNLIQLFLLIDGLKDLGGGRIYAVVPYLAYMRQDKRFLDGEIVSAHSILRLIKRLEVERFLTIDAHNRDTLQMYGSSAHDLTAMPLIAKWIRSRGWEDPLIIAPDKGAEERARIVSEELGADLAVGRKTRDRVIGKVEVAFDDDLKVENRIIAIVDDTISRGDTVIKSTEIMLKRGAKSVAALCTHGLFLENAAERIRSAGVREIVSTDTIPSPHSQISVAPLIADALKPFVS